MKLEFTLRKKAVINKAHGQVCEPASALRGCVQLALAADDDRRPYSYSATLSRAVAAAERQIRWAA